MSILKSTFSIFLFLCYWQNSFGQSSNLEIKQKKFRTSNGTSIKGESGYLIVPENRSNSESRNIKIKFVRLNSLSPNPHAPVIYLEGGGSACTWQADNPKYLTDWLPILKVSDLIFVDQRGTTDRKLTRINRSGYPEGFLVSSEIAKRQYQKLCKEALVHFEQKGIDVRGYHVEAHAKDINELTSALGIDKYSILGFSYGTHIGMALIRLYGEHIENAILASADGLDQSFNYPSYLDNHFEKISQLVKQDETISQTIPDLTVLLKKVMAKLSEEPVVVTVKNPINRKSIEVKIGPFGLALILRLDIDDSSDIPAIPRLLYSIDQGDYSMLQWFVQKRLPYTLAIPGNGINQGIASSASVERWKKIEQDASVSIFENVVNFPFYEANGAWLENTLSLDTTIPVKSNVRTLFITGDLDCRTPVQQVNEILQGFSNATHLIVKNAGHEQAMWNIKIFDEAIPNFLTEQDVNHLVAISKEIKFLPLTGESKGHPSIK